MCMKIGSLVHMSSSPYLLVTVWTAAQEIPDVSRIPISNNAILGMCIKMMIMIMMDLCT